MDDKSDIATVPTMVEIAVADIRHAGESGIALLNRLARLDRLIVDDPLARVVVLVRSNSLPPGVRQECTDGNDLVELAAAGRCRQPSLERVLWEHTQRVLARHRGNRKAASQDLRITDNTLRRRLASRPPE